MKPVELEEDHVDEYRLTDSLNCASQKIDATLPTSSVKPVLLEETPSVAVSTSTDPPGSGALKAVLYLMIIILILDGMRRWRLQKQCTQKPEDAENNLAKIAEAAAEAAWIDMVNAAASGDMNSFEMALNHKPKLMKADTWGCTPLHFAAVGGSMAISTELLNRGVDVDALDANEETPLHFAARAGHSPICDLLLGSGAKIDAVNVQGMTPLVLAGRANAESACRLLSDRGAGVSGMADEDLPPLVVSLVVQKVFASEH